MCQYFNHTFGNIDTETILEYNENKTNIAANLDDEYTPEENIEILQNKGNISEFDPVRNCLINDTGKY